MAARTLVAVDLDRTLIYSDSSAGDPATLPPLRLVELYDGAPLSRMTEAAWALLTRLMDTVDVVPVTTRTRAQYERIELPRRPRHALCANGGLLLTDGAPDAEWSQWARGDAGCARLDEVRGLLDAVADRPWVRTTRTAEDLFCYLVATERAAIPEEWLAGFTAAATAVGWSVSVQGRKVYAVPGHLSKGSGLRRLRDRVGAGSAEPVRLIAAGDSLLDASMLELADLAIRPAHGELHEQGWASAGVAVTGTSGALAGEELLGWLLDRVGDPVPA